MQSGGRGESRIKTYTVDELAHTINRHGASLDRGGLFSITLNAITLQRVGAVLGAVEVSLDVGSQVASVDICLFALVAGVALLDVRLVRLERGKQLLVADVVEEDALAKLAIRNGKALLAVTGLLDCLGGDGKERPTEVTRVNHWSRWASLIRPRA
jgi:hypothetical protein